MRTGAAGISLIKHFEGLRLAAYQCSANKWTIGYGHTQGVKRGMKITVKEAHNYLRDDLVWAENAVNKYVKVPLTQHQFDALVSFVFNVGAYNFARSTLLKRVNAGMFDKAANEFLRWNKAGGKVLEGLKRRREAEAKLFLTEA